MQHISGLHIIILAVSMQVTYKLHYIEKMFEESMETNTTKPILEYSNYYFGSYQQAFYFLNTNENENR